MLINYILLESSGKIELEDASGNIPLEEKNLGILKYGKDVDLINLHDIFGESLYGSIVNTLRRLHLN